MNTKTIQIRIADSLFDAVADASAKDRRTKGNFIINVLEQHPSVKDSLGKFQARACLTQTNPAKVSESKVPAADPMAQFRNLGQPKSEVPAYGPDGQEIE